MNTQVNLLFQYTLKFLFSFAIIILSYSNTYSQEDWKKQNIKLRSQLKFPGQGGANICGYAANGREYALFGTTTGTAIIDVTKPDTPVLLKHIDAVRSQWREIKVLKGYAYITTEGTGQGLQIVDLRNLPDTNNIPVKNFRGTDSTLLVISRAHTLHIDEVKEFVYLYGGVSRIKSGQDTLTVNGAVVLSLKDPWNPKFVGMYNAAYIHDGYVYNDTMYAAHIFGGYFSIVDFRDKTNPKLLNTQLTPTAFTHNTWLSDNRKVLFTTDENAGSFLAAYDISDPRNIKLLDKVRTSAEQNAIVHNTHILNDFAVSSWYTEGVTIVDGKRPQNLIQVAQYDSYDGTQTGFAGAWGVYPYLPSGNLIVSHYTADEGLFVLTPEYKRACYLEGNVVDSITNQPLGNVNIKINDTKDVDKKATTNVQGDYYTGQVTAGTFTVTYSRTGYFPKTVSVNLASGQVTLQNIKLRPINSSTIEIRDNWSIIAQPNPFNQTAFIQFNTQSKHSHIRLNAYNALGQLIESKILPSTEGGLAVGEQWVSGVYLVRLEAPDGVSRLVRLVKQ